jgi:hypothetical protein
MDYFEIKKRFTYHPPFGDQPQRYTELRDFAYTMACFIAAKTPECREQALALTRLEEVVFYANAAIARREENPAAPPPPEPGEHQTVDLPAAAAPMDVTGPTAPRPEDRLLAAIMTLRQAGILNTIPGPFADTVQVDVDTKRLARVLAPAAPMKEPPSC